jgi:hypothetical protein
MKQFDCFTGNAHIWRVPTPTLIELPSAVAIEAARAKFWRKAIARLTRKQLGEKIGYSTQAISLFEQGYDHRGRPIGERAWRRYRCCCAGIGIADFAWGQGEQSAQFRKDIEAGRNLLEKHA